MTERDRRKRFDALYASYDRRVFAYCIYVVGDHDLANDIYQEVFIKAYQALHTLRDEAKEANWLFRIARNECLNAMKSRQRNDKRHISLDSSPEPGIQGDGMTTRDAHDHLRKAINQLPTEYREALLLAEFEGFSLKEIAEITGASLSNVKVRIHRAKQKLYTLLEPILNDYE
ncbi:MAG: RNA polymerase sigma factor [Bacteroidetes bacterium]|nr:RNA polymerase sigma factor [Bacteroidota bacterium]